MRTDEEMAELNADLDRMIEEVRANPSDAQLWLNCRAAFQTVVNALQERIAAKAKLKESDNGMEA